MPEISQPPPPRPAWKRKGIPIVWIFVGVLSPVALLILGVVRMFGITKVPDNLFGDQHLKTTVALVELHKVRYGKYPDSLSA